MKVEFLGAELDVDAGIVPLGIGRQHVRPIDDPALVAAAGSRF